MKSVSVLDKDADLFLQAHLKTTLPCACLRAELADCGMVVAPPLISRGWPANKIDWISKGA